MHTPVSRAAVMGWHSYLLIACGNKNEHKIRATRLSRHPVALSMNNLKLHCITSCSLLSSTIHLPSHWTVLLLFSLCCFVAFIVIDILCFVNCFLFIFLFLLNCLILMCILNYLCILYIQAVCTPIASFRYSRGVFPVIFLKARLKFDRLLNPQDSLTSITETSSFSNKYCALAIL